MAVWLAAICLITFLMYLPGLSGPFLLDDIANLEPLGGWLAGAIDWPDVLLGNTSGPFGRPIAMASFMLDAYLFGGEPLPYKATNLAIHLACGLMVYTLCRRILERDGRLRDTACWWALGVTAVWLLHPIQVSTVLYVVQRMAQLSALFVLFALICYLYGRRLLESMQVRSGLFCLFIAFPLATLAAALCKENGVLAPLLALVLELAYFRGSPRSRAVRAFFLAFLVLPGLAIAGWYATHPASLLIGYETRDFTLGQRLLSEPRALLDYVGAILLPRGAALGLYGDDFVASTSLFTPVSTLPAIAFWVIASVLAWKYRKSSPTLFAGVFLFLTGHAMESTVFSLELYFEHRNYLPSIGVFLTLTALIERGVAFFGEQAHGRQLIRFGAVATILALGFATHTRAWSWQTWPVLVTQAAAVHPDSMRVQLDIAALFIKSHQPERAYEVFERLRSSDLLSARSVGAINPVTLDCQIYATVTPAHLADLRALTGQRIGGYEITAIKRLAEQLQAQPCTNLSNPDFAALLADIARRAPQSPSTPPIWNLRYIAASFHARAGDLASARDEAQAAWSTSANPPSGLLLARLLSALGQKEEAERVLTEVQPRIRRHDSTGRRALAETRAALLADKQHSTSP